MLVECLNCGVDYPPTACRWRCPGCGYKDSCCDGEAQPGGRVERSTVFSRRKILED